jgi:AbrB family looped-hinge helix DNA binding protein
MKATGIVRRIDDLGRVVIPKEIRRTMRIREGDPALIIRTGEDGWILAVLEFGERVGVT